MPSMKAKTRMFQFTDILSPYVVIFEDDGRAAYAYLLDVTRKEDDQMVSDVWLYNYGSPKKDEWKNQDNIPFKNLKSYIKSKLKPVTKKNELRVEWLRGRIVTVRLYVRNKLTAVLKPDARPGWCTLVKRDGPLANVLKE